MAQAHFNSRDPSVVPELANLGDCKITIDISNNTVFDANPFSHESSQNLINVVERPCAVVGPSTDQVALELSAVAQAAQYPIVVPRGRNLALAYGETYSFSASVFPDVASTAEVLAAYMNYMERTRYIAVLYELTDTCNQRREVLDVLFGHTIFSVGYSSKSSRDALSALEAMKQVKAKGLRTIVIAMEDPVGSFPLIADAAEHLGMNNGDHFYVWYDVMTAVSNWNANTNASKLVAGSAWIFPVENYFLHRDIPDPFLASWNKQGPDLVDRLNAANPIRKGEPGYIYAAPDYFQSESPDFGAGKLITCDVPASPLNLS